MRETDIQNIMDGVKTLERLSGGNLHHWRYVLENANSIWQKSPFKVGDLVRLTKTPEISKEKSWGWLGSKHFFIEGAIAKVVERQFYDGLFVYGLMFEDETWIDMNGKKNLPDRPAIYFFGENWLALANYNQLTCEAI